MSINLGSADDRELGHGIAGTPAARDRTGGETNRSHIPALDGIRGVAILLVLLNHAVNISLLPYDRGWHSFFANIVGSTGLGVHLFFVLSGFLITGLLLDAKGSRHVFLNFYGRRTLRILPLYYGTVIVFGAALHFSGSPSEALFRDRLPWLLTFTQNILITARNDWSFVFGGFSLAHFWSLAVEEQFYLVWPMVVLWCAPRTLIRICFVLIPLGLVARIALLYGANNLLGALVLLPCAVDSLAMGALVAVLVRQRGTFIEARGWPLALAGGVIWLVCCLDINLLLTLGISGFCLMSVGLLISGLRANRLSAGLCNPILRLFGKYSYAIYIFHVLILAWVSPLKAKLGLAPFVIGFVALAFLAGWLSWHLFETHFLRLKVLLPMQGPSGSKQGSSPKPAN